MSNMKCPFCNKPLQPTLRLSDEYWCENYDCPRTNIKWTGSQALWQELIRTRKALDVAKHALQRIHFRGSHSKFWVGKDDGTIALKALNKIIALEQKE